MSFEHLDRGTMVRAAALLLALGAGGCGAATPAAPDADERLEPTCPAYCALIQDVCTDTAEQYSSVLSCTSYCENFGGLPLGREGEVDGNTVGCRMYHATVAATVDRDFHCEHAGPTGGDVCGTWCDNYCHLAMRNCTGEEALFSDATACRAECQILRTDGQIGDDSGNSVQCRIFWLGIAGTEPPQSARDSCPRGAIDGGDACI